MSEPTEMVERVSDAVAKAIAENPTFENIARAAIRAMLEPTHDMAVTGGGHVLGTDAANKPVYLGYGEAVEIYEAMISSALGEE